MYSSDTARASLLAALLLLVLWPAAQAQSIEADGASKLDEAPPAQYGGDALIYDQTGSTTGSGTLAQYNATNSEFDVLLADDFTVPNGLTWEINTFVAAGFYSGGTDSGDCERANVIVWTASADGEPDAQLFTFEDVAPTTDTGGDLSIGFLFVDVPTVTLPGGDYWVTFACEGANLDVLTGGRWNWARSNGNVGEVAQIRNDGGGFGLPTGWNDNPSGSGNDRSFALFGQESGTALIPQLTAEQSDLTAMTPPDGVTTRVLTLRNTGTDVLTWSIPEFDTPAPLTGGMPAIRFDGYPTLRDARGGSVYNRTGMDAFGYVFKDNDEADGPAANFTDISGTGTVGPTGDDSGVTVALPFGFSFYGDTKTDVTISSNGYLTFGPDGTDFSNDPIPTGFDPNDYIAPFWDDLNPNDADAPAGSGVYYQDMMDGRFIVQWNEIPPFAGDGTTNLTFQAVLFADGSIEFHYLDMLDPSETATIGIENADATDGLEISFNETGYATNGRAIRIEFDASAADFLTDADPSSGTLAPGEDVNVTVTFDAAGLTVGTYTDALNIVSNGGDVTVPATLDVVGPPEIFVDPLLLEATLDSGETETRPITITNTGLEDLEFSFAGYSDATAQAPANYGPRSKVTLDKGEDGPTYGAQSFGAGGPDGFGYVWVDSDESGGPAVDFQDISGTGVEIVDTDWIPTGTFDPADEGYFDIALPFDFPFYGETQTSFRVNTNGFGSFGTAGFDVNQFTNQPIPTDDEPNALLAPFWDDLNLADNGSVFYGLTDDGRFAIQWEGVSRFAQSELNTFQIILGENGTIEYQYAGMNATTLDGATVGIENLDGTDGLQIAFNEAYVQSSFAVLIAQETPLVSDVSPASGTVAPGQSVTVTATVSADELFAGMYEDDLVIVSNDPVRPTTVVDIQVTVTGDPMVMVDPTVVRFGEVFVGDEGTETITITNTGTDVLTIGAITSDDAAFTASGASSGTVAPGESATFEVFYRPTQLAPSAGTITVSTDAGDRTIAVSGVAAPAPVASVTPESLDPATADDVDELVLMNDGVGRLFFEVEATSVARMPDSAAPTDPIVTVTDDPVVSQLTAGEGATSTPPVMAGANAAPGDVLFSVGLAAGSSALGITQDLDGTVYVADISNGTTQTFDADLNATGSFNHPVLAGEITGGVAYNATTETLWYQSVNTGSAQSTLLEANLDGTATGNTIALPNSGGLLTGVEYSPELGRYYYVDISNDDIVAVDQDGNLVPGYPVPQTSGDTGEGAFGNGLDVLGGGLDVVFGAIADGQATDAVVTDLNGVNVGASTPFAQTGDTFVNDITRSRIAPNEIMYVVGNSSSTIYAVEPVFRDDVEGGGGGGVDYISVSPEDGSVAPASNRTLTVTYDDEGLEAGTYMAMIVIRTNDPMNPVLEVPVTLTVSAGVANEDEVAVTEFALTSSAPNPAVGQTSLRYAVPTTSDVLIEVYDLMGRRVATIVDGEQTAGRKTVQWDASSLAGGVYVYRMTAGSFAQTMKMVVVR